MTKFGQNILENDEITLFQPRQPSFHSVPSVVFTRSLLVALKKPFVGDEVRMQTWK